MLDANGLTIKTLAEIKTEIEADLRSILGQAINLLPEESLGQTVGIFSEREAKIWELVQDVYNAMYPNTSNGVSLDNALALTGVKRLQGNKSTVEIIASGTETTVIPTSFRASVAGNPDALFGPTEEKIIGPGTDEVQSVEFDAVPDAGAFTLIFNGEETVAIPFSASNTDVQNALNGLGTLDGVVVSGDFSTGFEVTFAGAFSETPQPLIEEGNTNTLESSATPVVVTITETTPGQFPNVTIPMQAIDIGPIQAKAGFLTVIETPIVGLDTITNPLDAIVGRNVETDAEAKIRRSKTLANPGTATVEAIRSRLLQLEEVLDARVYQNFTETTDASGRPAKSMEPVVDGADDQVIADLLWSIWPGGIRFVGSETVPIVDSQGFDQNIRFSRPVDVEIYIDVEVEINSDFPVAGDDLIVNGLLNFATENQKIGVDVINSRLICPVVDVPGVTDVTIFIGTAPTPTLEDNIPIEDIEKAVFDSSRITVTHV